MAGPTHCCAAQPTGPSSFSHDVHTLPRLHSPPLPPSGSLPPRFPPASLRPRCGRCRACWRARGCPSPSSDRSWLGCAPAARPWASEAPWGWGWLPLALSCCTAGRPAAAPVAPCTARLNPCLPHPAERIPACPRASAGVDPLPEELQGQLETETLTAPFFIEAAVVLPQHRALLLADTGGLCRGLWGSGWQGAPDEN